MCIFVAHEKAEKKKCWLWSWKEPKTTPVHVHICLCMCVFVVCVRKRERMHTSVPECVISVFSHRQRPKPSYKPRSWCYFCLWPGVMKLWCRKTSQPFLSACGSSQSSPQLQADDDECCPQSI